MVDANIKVHEATKNYEEESGYDNPSTWRHGLAHIMATTLAHPDHLMDYEYAEKNMPKNRISGYEAEPMAAVYQAAIASYPKTWKESFKAHFKNLHSSNQIITSQDTTVAFLDHNIGIIELMRLKDIETIKENRQFSDSVYTNKTEDYEFLVNSVQEINNPAASGRGIELNTW